MENTRRRGEDGVIWRRVELTASYSYRFCSLLGRYHKAEPGPPGAGEGPEPAETTFQLTWCLCLPPAAEWDWAACFHSRMLPARGGRQRRRPAFFKALYFCIAVRLLVSSKRRDEEDLIYLSKWSSAAWNRRPAGNLWNNRRPIQMKSRRKYVLNSSEQMWNHPQPSASHAACFYVLIISLVTGGIEGNARIMFSVCIYSTGGASDCSWSLSSSHTFLILVSKTSAFNLQRHPVYCHRGKMPEIFNQTTITPTYRLTK